MARNRGRSVADVTRYTGSSSRPPSFGDDSIDDSITSGTSFVLISLVVFVAIVFAAIQFGTSNIEDDLAARSYATLQNAGFTAVDVEANGTTVHLSGSIDPDQTEESAFTAVLAVTGVSEVEGKLWPVFSGELEEIVVTGDAIEINWDGFVVTVEGTVASEDRRAFVSDTLSEEFSNVNTESLTVLEGLQEDPGWLGTTLGLVISIKPTLTSGRLIVDPNSKLLVVAGEVEGKDVRNELNAAVIEAGDQLGFKVNPAIRVLVVGPTEEEIEEFQVDLDALIEGKVVEFEIKSFDLTAKGIALLDEILMALEEAPEIRVRIEGHTDSRGSDAENLLLSENRANAVLAYLVAAGQSSDRFDIVGYGETQETASNDTAEGRARNRRIEFIALEGTG